MEENLYFYRTVHQSERERVGKFIEDIKNDATGAPYFLNLFAPKGFGKTAFLVQIWEEYERVLPSSLVRVGDFQWEDDKHAALRELLILVIHDLKESLPRRVAPVSSNYEDLTDEEQLANLLVSFVSGAKDFEKVTLLLIDDYDRMPEEQRRWFQSNILSPASITRKFD